MKAVIQRVNRAKVIIDNETIASINRGLMLLLGIAEGDSEEDINYLTEKISNLRIFEDGEGKMNLSCLDIKGEVLVVSQFTLLADTRKGRRPSFVKAAKPDMAIPLYEKFLESLKATGLTVEAGKFGAKMLVEINNSGPVTIVIDSKEKR